MPRLPIPPYDRIPSYITAFQSSPVNIYNDRKNTLNLFSPLTTEAKGSNKFYFPHKMFGIFLFEIKILLYKLLEHQPYVAK